MTIDQMTQRRSCFPKCEHWGVSIKGIIYTLEADGDVKAFHENVKMVSNVSDSWSS